MIDDCGNVYYQVFLIVGIDKTVLYIDKTVFNFNGILKLNASKLCSIMLIRSYNF